MGYYNSTRMGDLLGSLVWGSKKWTNCVSMGCGATNDIRVITQLEMEGVCTSS
jgi:hypothetical protein